MSKTAVPNYAWMYWEDVAGRRRAPYLDLCFQTVSKQADGLDLMLTGPESIFEYLPDLDRSIWEALPGPNFRSDYARTRLLHRHGGIWLDFDLIAMRPLSELVAPLAREDILGWGRENRGRFYAGLCAARPGSPFVARWLEEQARVADGLMNGEELRWPALAQHITEPLAKELGYAAWPLDRIAPVMWWEWRRFTSRFDSPRRVLSPGPYTVMLFHKVMGPWCGTWSAEEVLEGRHLLARLLRIALGITTVDEEQADIGKSGLLAQIRFSPAGRELEKQYRWRIRGLPRDEL